MYVEEFPYCCGFKVIMDFRGMKPEVLDLVLKDNDDIVGPGEDEDDDFGDSMNDNSGRAAILIALNEKQQPTYAPILRSNGYVLLLQGLNDHHDSMCFLWGKVGDGRGKIAKDIET